MLHSEGIDDVVGDILGTVDEVGTNEIVGNILLEGDEEGDKVGCNDKLGADDGITEGKQSPPS